MKKPKCRLCQTEHYSHEAHVWPETTNVATEKAIARPEAHKVGRRPKAKPAPDHAPSNESRLRADRPASGTDVTPFDRTAYQRDYMKNTYRPKVKAKQEADAAELKRLRELVKDKTP